MHVVLLTLGRIFLRSMNLLDLYYRSVLLVYTRPMSVRHRAFDRLHKRQRDDKQELSIVLVCDNILRELTHLTLLKMQLEETLQARVTIIGSVAEIQRTYYLIHQLKPHIVILNQVVEDGMRDLAKYIRQSGAKVYVLPPEILVVPALSNILAISKLKFNHLIDGILLPGERMKKLFLKSDIQPNKIMVVGSPKIDVLMRATAPDFYSRTTFLEAIHARKNKKNIVVFTSFVPTPKTYLRKTKTFVGNIRKMSQNNVFVEEAQRLYPYALEKLCEDFPDYNIILKRHPREVDVYYQHIQKPNFFVASNMSFYNVVNSIDLAIHWSSTIATECWLRGITTVQYVPNTRTTNFLIESWRGNPVTHTYVELKKAVQKYMDMKLEKKYLKFQKQYLKENYYKSDGKSVERISERLLYSCKKQVHPHYIKRYSFFMEAFVMCERYISSYLPRRLASLILQSFDWKYAVKNYIETGTA